MKRILFLSDHELVEKITEFCSDQGFFCVISADITVNEIKQKYPIVITDDVHITENSDFFRNISMECSVIVISSLEKKDQLFSDPYTESFKYVYYEPFNKNEFLHLLHSVLADTQLKLQRDLIKTQITETLTKIDEFDQDFEKKIKNISALSQNELDPVFLFDELLKTILRLLAESFKCERCSVFIIDQAEKDFLILAKYIDGEMIIDEKKMEIRGEVIKHVIAHRKPIVVKNIRNDQRFSKISSQAYKTTSFISYPLIISRRVVAVFNITDKDTNAAFTKKDLEKASGIIERIARTVKYNNKTFSRIIKKGLFQERIYYSAGSEISELSVELNETRKQLKQRLEEINTIRNISRVIKTTFVIEELLKMIVDTISLLMRCHRSSVLLIDQRNGDLMVKGMIGKNVKKVENFRIKQRGEITKYIIENKCSVLYPSRYLPEELENIFSRRSDTYTTDSFLCVPIIIRNNVVAIINITEKENNTPFNENDCRMLEIIAEQTAVSIDNFRLSEQLVEKERIGKELEIANSIQLRLFPEQCPVIDGVDIAARSIPAKEVGGDYYDFVQFNEHETAVAIGDVSGKGIPAALFMVMVRSVFRSLIDNKECTAEIMSSINDLIQKDIEESMFVSFCFGNINMQTRKMVYTNAGHNYPILIRNGNAAQYLTSEDVILGMFEGQEYHQKAIDLKKDDVLVFYTDGITEAVNIENEMFEEERLVEIIEKNKHRGAADIMNAILSEVDAFCENQSQYDDMTVLVVKVVS